MNDFVVACYVGYSLSQVSIWWFRRRRKSFLDSIPHDRNKTRCKKTVTCQT